MYQINYYNQPVYDDQLQELFPVLNAQLNLEVNNAGGLNFSIPFVHPNFEDLKKLKMGIAVVKNGKTIFKGRIIKDTQDFNNSKSFECEGKLAAFNDTIYRPYDFSGSPTDYFTSLIENHNSMVEEEKQFIVGEITVADPNDYITRSSIDYNTTWELLKNLVESLGGYLHIRYEDDGDYIDWLADFQYTNTQKIEFAENLLDITQEVTAEETYTACIPLGAVLEITNYGEVAEEEPEWQEETYYTLSGENYVLITSESEFNSALSAGTTIYTVTSTESTNERLTVASVNDGSDVVYNTEKVEEYGWKFAPAEVVTWEDVKIPENLLKKATAFLNNEGVMLKATLELSAVDLAYTDADIDSFEFCQYVQVESLPHNLEKSYLLSKADIDMLHPENTKITLGDSEFTLYDSLLGQQQQLESAVEKIESKNEAQRDEIYQEISETETQILKTAEEITLGILSGYTSVSDLESYKKEVENLFKGNKDGFEMLFNQLESTVNGEITERSQCIRFINGEIHIGKNDSPITAIFTNNALEFRYNNQMVARFTNEVLEVRNIAVDNQVGFFDNWAIRQGAYKDGVGYNLNDVWIGG